MNFKDFNNAIVDQVDFCKELMLKKGKEYAENSSEQTDVDRLDSFKKYATVLNCTQEKAIYSMLTKHFVSLGDMVENNNDYPLELWTEKITDSINYLLILKAAVLERENKKVKAGSEISNEHCR